MFEFICRNYYTTSMKAVVSEKGQVTIPKALRDRLGIRAGHELIFREEAGKLIVVRAALPVDTIKAVRGILRGGKRSDEWMDELRGKPDAVDPKC